MKAGADSGCRQCLLRSHRPSQASTAAAAHYRASSRTRRFASAPQASASSRRRAPTSRPPLLRKAALRYTNRAPARGLLKGHSAALRERQDAKLWPRAVSEPVVQRVRRGVAKEASCRQNPRHDVAQHPPITLATSGRVADRAVHWHSARATQARSPGRCKTRFRKGVTPPLSPTADLIGCRGKPSHNLSS